MEIGGSGVLIDVTNGWPHSETQERRAWGATQAKSLSTARGPKEPKQQEFLFFRRR